MASWVPAFVPQFSSGKLSMKRNVVYSISERQATRVEKEMLTSKVRYEKVPYDDDGFADIQFNTPPTKVPWKAIGLAATLFILGSALISIGALLLGGVIDAKYNDRTWPVLILGSILFIPGFYHVRIAYYAWQGETGYSFDDIPDFD